MDVVTEVISGVTRQCDDDARVVGDAARQFGGERCATAKHLLMQITTACIRLNGEATPQQKLLLM